MKVQNGGMARQEFGRFRTRYKIKAIYSICIPIMSSHTLKVQFANHDTVHYIKHLNDMEDDEVFSVFFTVAERKAMRDECMTLARIIDEGLHVSGGKEVFDTRGLEAYTRQYARRSRELRDTIYGSIHAVQDAKDDCWGDGDVSEIIANLSRQVSAISRGIAAANAKDDARAIRSKKSRDSICSYLETNKLARTPSTLLFRSQLDIRIAPIDHAMGSLI
jgi:hypothetical protein